MTENVALNRRSLSLDDAPSIAAAIPELARIGLKPCFPEGEYPDVALRKAEQWEGIGIPASPSPAFWAYLTLIGSEQVFTNAINFQDHCYDGADEAVYVEVVASIMALAGAEWPEANVSALGVVREGEYGPSHRLEINVSGPGGCAPFDLIVAKDFDWSVVTRLNERLPAGATGRFAALFDGNATIVYLRGDQIEAMAELLGYGLMSEIDPLPERPPVKHRHDIAIQRPLPVWAIILGFPLGVVTAWPLIAMILRGAPYAMQGNNMAPVSLSKAPFDFALLVMVHFFGVMLFLGAPSYLWLRKYRARRQAEEWADEEARRRS